MGGEGGDPPIIHIPKFRVLLIFDRPFEAEVCPSAAVFCHSLFHTGLTTGHHGYGALDQPLLLFPVTRFWPGRPPDPPATFPHRDLETFDSPGLGLLYGDTGLGWMTME